MTKREIIHFALTEKALQFTNCLKVERREQPQNHLIAYPNVLPMLQTVSSKCATANPKVNL